MLPSRSQDCVFPRVFLSFCRCVELSLLWEFVAFSRCCIWPLCCRHSCQECFRYLRWEEGDTQQKGACGRPSCTWIHPESSATSRQGTYPHALVAKSPPSRHAVNCSTSPPPSPPPMLPPPSPSHSHHQGCVIHSWAGLANNQPCTGAIQISIPRCQTWCLSLLPVLSSVFAKCVVSRVHVQRRACSHGSVFAASFYRRRQLRLEHNSSDRWEVGPNPAQSLLACV